MKKLLLIGGVVALMCCCGKKSPVDNSIITPLTETELVKIDKEFPQYAEMCRGLKEYNFAENLNEAQKTHFKPVTYRRLGDFVAIFSEKDLFEISPDELKAKDALCFEFVGLLFSFSGFDGADPEFVEEVVEE